MPRTHDFGFFKVRWVARYGWVMDRSGAIAGWEAAHPARVDTRPAPAPAG